MMKCIGDLRSCNEQRQRSLAKFNNDIRSSGNFIVPVRGLTDLVRELGTKQSTASIDCPAPEGVDFAAEIISIMNKVFDGIVENNSSDASFKIDDVKALIQLLDLMIRHESFSVDQRTKLFGWRSECEKTILKLSPESEISDLLNRQVGTENKVDVSKGKQRQRQSRNRPARPAPPAPGGSGLDAHSEGPGYTAFDEVPVRRGQLSAKSRPWSEPNLMQSLGNANADSISQISLSSIGSAGSAESDLSWDQLRNTGVQYLFNADDEHDQPARGSTDHNRFLHGSESTVIRRPDNMGRSGSGGSLGAIGSAPGHELRQSQLSATGESAKTPPARPPRPARPNSMFADITAWGTPAKVSPGSSGGHAEATGSRVNSDYHPFQGLSCHPLDEFGGDAGGAQAQPHMYPST